MYWPLPPDTNNKGESRNTQVALACTPLQLLLELNCILKDLTNYITEKTQAN